MNQPFCSRFLRLRWAAFAVATHLAWAGLVAAATDGPAAHARDPEAEALIAQLVNVGTPTTGTNPFATAQQFLALNEAPIVAASNQPAGVPRLEWHPTPEPMRRLVQMGLAALPAVLDHLDDARPTKLIINNRGARARGLLFGTEYEPRLPVSAIGDGLMAGTAPGQPAPNGPYTLRVGDLCFVIVGQIVNRNLNAVRSEPAGDTIINSPVMTPALAAQVRQDWSNLTADAHRELLLAESTPGNRNGAGALQRLEYYYPDAGEKRVVELLGAPFVSQSRIQDFLIHQILPTDDDVDLGSLHDEALHRFGAPALSVMLNNLKAWTAFVPADLPKTSLSGQTVTPWQLQDVFYVRTITSADGVATTQSILRQPEWGRAQEVIDAWSPPPTTPAPPAPVDLDDLAGVINDVQGFPNARVDDAAFALFHSALAADRDDGLDQNSLDDLAIACANRLAGKAHAAEMRQYLQQRLDDEDADAAASPFLLERLQQAINKLDAAEPNG